MGSGRWLAHVEPSHLWMRAGVLLLLLAVWGWRVTANQELRRIDEEAALRTQVLKEIRLARVAAVESQAFLPEPGTGHSAWWRDKIEREVKRAGLTVAKHDARPSAHAIGTFLLERRELVVLGPYDGVVRLVAWTETSTPRLRVQDFELVPAAPGQVRATLILMTPVAEGAR